MLQIHAEIAAASKPKVHLVTEKRPISASRLHALATEHVRPQWRAAELDLWRPHETFGTDDDPIRLLHKQLEILQGNDYEVWAGITWAAECILNAAGHYDADSNSIETLASFLRRGDVDITETCLRHYGGDTSHQLRDPLFVRLNDAPRSMPDQVEAAVTAIQRKGRQAVTVRQAIARYFGDPQRANLSPKNAAGYATGFKLLNEVVGPDIPLDEVTLDHAQAVQHLLSRLPPNATKRFPGLTCEQAATEAEIKGLPPLEAKTALNVLTRLAAFFHWAVNQELIPRPRFHNLRPLQKKKSKAASRQSFSEQDLSKLFSSAMYLESYDTVGALQPGRYWVPLLALYQGCRLNEACQLETSDIAIVDGIPCIHLTEDGVQGRTKRLKTHKSERTIPLHPVLVKLGFLEHVKRVRALEERRVFPELTRGSDGYLSTNFSKWFGRYSDKQGVTDRRLLFHCFRHGFADACRAVDIKDEVWKRLGGWEVGQSAADGYGGGYTLRRGVTDLAKVSFPSVEKLFKALQGVNDKGEEAINNNQTTVLDEDASAN